MEKSRLGVWVRELPDGVSHGFYKVVYIPLFGGSKHHFWLN